MLCTLCKIVATAAQLDLCSPLTIIMKRQCLTDIRSFLSKKSATNPEVTKGKQFNTLYIYCNEW